MNTVEGGDNLSNLLAETIQQERRRTDQYKSLYEQLKIELENLRDNHQRLEDELQNSENEKKMLSEKFKKCLETQQEECDRLRIDNDSLQQDVWTDERLRLEFHEMENQAAHKWKLEIESLKKIIHQLENELEDKGKFHDKQMNDEIGKRKRLAEELEDAQNKFNENLNNLVEQQKHQQQKYLEHQLIEAQKLHDDATGSTSEIVLKLQKKLQISEERMQTLKLEKDQLLLEKLEGEDQLNVLERRIQHISKDQHRDFEGLMSENSHQKDIVMKLKIEIDESRNEITQLRKQLTQRQLQIEDLHLEKDKIGQELKQQQLHNAIDVDDKLETIRNESELYKKKLGSEEDKNKRLLKNIDQRDKMMTTIDQEWNKQYKQLQEKEWSRAAQLEAEKIQLDNDKIELIKENQELKNELELGNNTLKKKVLQIETENETYQCRIKDLQEELTLKEVELNNLNDNQKNFIKLEHEIRKKNLEIDECRNIENELQRLNTLLMNKIKILEEQKPESGKVQQIIQYDQSTQNMRSEFEKIIEQQRKEIKKIKTEKKKALQLLKKTFGKYQEKLNEKSSENHTFNESMDKLKDLQKRHRQFRQLLQNPPTSFNTVNDFDYNINDMKDKELDLKLNLLSGRMHNLENHQNIYLDRLQSNETVKYGISRPSTRSHSQRRFSSDTPTPELMSAISFSDEISTKGKYSRRAKSSEKQFLSPISERSYLSNRIPIDPTVSLISPLTSTKPSN